MTSDSHAGLRKQEATDAGAGAYFGEVEESAKSALYAFESMPVSFRSTCTSTRTVRRGERRCGLISRGAEATRLHAQPSARAPKRPLTRIHAHHIYKSYIHKSTYQCMYTPTSPYAPHRKFQCRRLCARALCGSQTADFCFPQSQPAHGSQIRILCAKVYTCVCAVVGRPTNLAAHIVPVSLLARASILAPVVDQV